MRIRGAKTEMEEAGLETDGMASSTAKLREEIKALSGVDIMLDDTTFKSTYKIMEELAAKWQDLTDIQQASVTELIAGKRQGNIVSSLMTNFDIAQNALQTSLNSSGSAMEEHKKYMDSIEAKLSQLKASWQSFAQTFMDSDLLKGGIDALKGLVDILESLIDNFGLLGTTGIGVLGKGAFDYFKSFKNIGNIAESAGDAAEAINDVVEAAGDIAQATGDTAEGIGNVVEAAGNGIESMTNLAGATNKTTGSFKSFIKTPMGVASAIGLVVAAIGLAINAFKNMKEAEAEARQEAIETADTFLNSTSSFEQAYIKYSGRTDLTVEEEAELESAIKGTVDALDDKSSALANVVNGSNDYVKSLEQIAKAELEAAQKAAEKKKIESSKQLTETVKGWFAIDGSEVNIDFGSSAGIDKDVLEIINEAGSEYLVKNFKGNGKQVASLNSLQIDANASIDEIINYYDTLVRIQNQLEKSDLADTAEYDKVTEAIGKMSDSISVYVDGVYDAAKAQYQFDNGIPKTVENYLAMREAILNNEDIDNLSVSTKKSIANSLDSEYAKSFDLSSVEIQARKLIGILDEYGDVEAGEMETFLNMRTAVNNNECTVGEYMSQFKDINKMTEEWSNEAKEELNTSFGLDTDTIKQQYDDMTKYLMRSFKPSKMSKAQTIEGYGATVAKETVNATKGIQDFLNSLTADELAAVIQIRTEIDWANTSAEDIRKQIDEQVKVDKAMNFEANIEIDTTALETMNEILAESTSAMGLSAKSIDSLQAKYADLEDYDPATLFERTGNGVKVNREELEKLEKKQNDLTKSKVQDHLDTLIDKYNDVTAEIDKCTNAGERAELLSEREGYKNKIEELATYQAQLEGVTGAYQDWINAQSASEDYEGYESVATSRETIKEEIDRGFIGNKSKKYIDLLSGKDLDGKSIDDYANAWEKLDDKVTGAGYSINDFFTVNDDGDITATGIDRFFKSLQTDFEGSVAKFDEKTKKWSYDFGSENLEKIKEKWGIGIEAIELLLEAAVSAGYDIDWDGILDGIDFDTSNFETLVSAAESAQTAFNKLEGVEDVDFNFTATGVKEATSELEKAHSTYIDLITNKDGTINLNANGAAEMRVILSTLLIQKQQLEDSTIAINIDTSGLDESQQDIANAINAVKTFREKYKNLEIAVTTGQGIEEAKTELNTAMTELQGLGDAGVDIAAELILGEGATAESLNSKVDAAISAVGSKDIKVGCKLDETDLGSLNSQVLANFTPEATVKITGIDDSLVNQYTSTEKTANGTVKWKNDESLVIQFQDKTHKASGIVDWANNVEKVKTTFSAAGTVTWTSGNNVKVNVISEAKGTANANGSTGRAFARGNWGIKGNGTALGGELGRELVVRDGKFFTIGDSGAEFFHYKKNDIIFNAAQTESLFKYGGIKGAKPRGTMLASGSAFSDGSTQSNGKAFAWSASGSMSNFASKRVRQESNTGTKANTKTKTTSNNSSVTTTTTTTWGANAKEESDFAKERQSNITPSSTSSSSSSSSSEKDFKESFDWIEVAISRLERTIDQLDKKVSNVYSSWSDRNDALSGQIGKVRDEIDLQQQAYDRYMQEANSVGLSSSWAEKVRNGKVDINTITDEKLAEKIGEYQNWYEKALACEDAILDLKEAESSLYAQRFENVQTQYDTILQGYEHTETMLNEYISQAEEQGYIVSKKYYDALIANEKSNIDELKKEQIDLIVARDEAVDSGAIKKYSEDWYNMCADIDSVTQAIEESETALLEYDNAMRDIDWQIFDLMQERISDVASEADFLIELMSNKKLFDDDGKLTSQGLATMGLHAQNYNTNMYQADEYGEEIAELNKQIANDPYDQELINRRRELIEAQRESILAAEDEKNAIRDMVEEGIEYELDALQERIDKYNESIDAAKDLYDYQKRVKEESKEIASLEKQMAAYQGDDSEEAKSKIQELRVSLDEAKENLQETEYDRYISDQQALLDTLYTEYELILNQRLDNVDALLEEVISSINAVAGVDGVITSALGNDGAIAIALGNNAVSIKDTLKSETDKVGVTLSNAMNSIWSVGEGNAKSVLTMYGEDFRTKATTTNTTLGSIKADINAMVDDIDKDAKKKVEAPKTQPSTKADPTKTSSTTSNTNKTPTTKPTSTGDGKPKVGDKVKFVSGSYYYDSQGTKPLGSKYQGKEVYITSINNKSWATHPYHISTGNKLGSGDLGWLKLNQLSGYAIGKQNFLNDEIAWTQENGKEFIVRPSDGAILTPVARGDSILDAQASSNIWKMANSPAEFIRDNFNFGTTDIPNNSNAQNSYTQILDKVVFNMPNVKNYNEFLTALKSDKNFERLILSMTLDQVAGKSGLAKGKSIR